MKATSATRFWRKAAEENCIVPDVCKLEKSVIDTII
jgi:hypothetical protein